MPKSRWVFVFVWKLSCPSPNELKFLTYMRDVSWKAGKVFKRDFIYLFIFRERGREGEREGEKHQCEREKHLSIASSPTWNLTHDWRPTNWATLVREAGRILQASWPVCFPHLAGLFPYPALPPIFLNEHLVKAHGKELLSVYLWAPPENFRFPVILNFYDNPHLAFKNPWQFYLIFS